MMPKISVVIPCFNARDFIRTCLEALCTQDWQDFEVIVVDNGSKDGTVDFIKENYPKIILIENRENLGACKARNQGIGASKGEWILTLDCDIILDRSFLPSILKAIQSLSPKTGIIQTRILKADRKTIYSTGIFLSFLRRFYDIGQGKPDNGHFDTSGYIFGACAAAAIYKHQMLEEIKEKTGYFDERFFFLVEDVDLAWRAQKRGWRAIFYPEAICYHYGNSSIMSKKARQYLSFRNRELMIHKNETNLGKIKLIFLGFPFQFTRWFHLLCTNKYFIDSLNGVYENWRPGKAA